MKVKILLLLYMVVISTSCNNTRSIEELYKLYERELIKGNTKNAETALDEIIKKDKSIKYIKLKIPFLISACKKEEALKNIDLILKEESTNYELLFLIILLTKNNSVKTNSILKMKEIISSNIKNKSYGREKEIMYIIFIDKIQDIKNNNFLYTLKLSNQEKEVLNIYKDISKKEIENIIPSC